MICKTLYFIEAIYVKAIYNNNILTRDGLPLQTLKIHSGNYTSVSEGDISPHFENKIIVDGYFSKEVLNTILHNDLILLIEIDSQKIVIGTICPYNPVISSINIISDTDAEITFIQKSKRFNL